MTSIRNLAALRNAVQVDQNATHARARLTLPNGKVLKCVIRCDTPEALGAELDALEWQGLAGDDDDVELAGFFKKLKKAAKKVGKVALAPVKIAHKITHTGPIGKLHKQVQNTVAKALPFTKPFIKVHNSLAAPVHKAIEGKKVKQAVTAKAIADVTKHLPAAAKGPAQAALVARAKQDDALKSIAKSAAKAKVVSEAKKAAKKGDAEAKSFLKRAAVGRTGTYEVRTPSGRVIKVPAAKVAR
ncbi:MAG TPA: hypothetical protein VGK73_00065 [Polyangiaceae bacterium]